MGTSFTVKFLADHNKTGIESLENSIHMLLDEINQGMSTYLPDSELSMINNNTGDDWMPLSRNLYIVIKNALSISEQTDGAFDITIGPLVNLWGFGPGQKPDTTPSDQVIRQYLQNTGYKLLQLRSEPFALKKSRPSVYIDLSGIAKGFAVDQIASLLEARKIHNYMIEIGGEIRARGHNHNNKIWRIGIEKPLYESRAIQDVIELNNTAMASSGDYRNYYEIDGNRFSHTIDPGTGRPVTHNLAAVTVLHDSAMIADALATAIMVMGAEKGGRYATEHGYAALLVTRDINMNTVTGLYTGNFREYIVEKAE